MSFLYIIKSKTTSETYIGVSDNLDRRLKEHNLGINDSTKHLTDWVLIYSEVYELRSIALAREKFFKTGDGRKVLKLKGVL